MKFLHDPIIARNTSLQQAGKQWCPVGEPDAGDRRVRFDERGWETRQGMAIPWPAKIKDKGGIRSSAPAALRRWMTATIRLFPFTGKINRLTITLDAPKLTPENEKRLEEANRAAQDAK